MGGRERKKYSSGINSSCFAKWVFNKLSHRSYEQMNNAKCYIFLSPGWTIWKVMGGRLSVSIARASFHSNAYFFSCLTLHDFFVLFSPPQPCHLSNGLSLTVADLGEGPRGFRLPPFGALFAKYLKENDWNEHSKASLVPCQPSRAVQSDWALITL